MIRLNLGLSAAIVASAWVVVHTQYESRRLFIAVDRATAAATDLELEWESLRAQHRIESAPARIQRIAREQLQMRAPDPATTLYLPRQPSQEVAP